MKISEINKYINKIIGPNLPSYFVQKDLIYRIDSEYFLKYYCVVSTGNDEDDFYISVAVQPLYVKSDYLYKTLGFNLTHKKQIGVFRSKKTELWDARKEHLDSSFQSILKSIQEQGEPFLNSINTANDFYNKFFKEVKENLRILEAVAYSAILIFEKEKQDKLLKSLIKEAEDNKGIEWVQQIGIDANLMLGKKTQEERIVLLKTWGNETIKYLKLPHLKSLN